MSVAYRKCSEVCISRERMVLAEMIDDDVDVKIVKVVKLLSWLLGLAWRGLV